VRAIAALAIAIACNSDPPAPATTRSGAKLIAPNVKLGTPRPELMPSLGGELLLPPTPTADHHLIHATWCLAADSFGSAIGAVRASLEDQLWTGSTVRGDNPSAAITAERDGSHLGVIVAALRAGPCAEPGFYRVTATLTTAGN
jgi:hypothetical protein